MIEFKEQSAIAPPGTTIEEFETYCGLAAEMQRAVNWILGDLALAVERQHPNSFNQAWPPWVSPDLIARCKGVARAYSPDERNLLGTWTMHSFHAKNPSRVAMVQSIVDAGQTTDEARKNPPKPTATKQDWLLAVDVNYFIHRYFHSGAGVEAASTFDGWLARLIERLREKGLTDVVCCFDSRTNHRKKLTEGWESAYKPRAEKDQELSDQLNLAPELLKARNLACVSIDDMEADDVMASYAVQFPGRVTLLTQDKDMRQCLSEKCNMLIDVTWEENTETGDHLPVYKWVSAKQHTEEGVTYSGTKVVGITPEQWTEFQAIAGDSTDGIKGVDGIGGKGAMDLIKAHGTVKKVIEAAKDGAADVSEKKRLALVAFEDVHDVMLQLVTLRNDLVVQLVTKLFLKDTQ